jgi:hypoxanthine phosphoribosyltransferase
LAPRHTRARARAGTAAHLAAAVAAKKHIPTQTNTNKKQEQAAAGGAAKPATAPAAGYDIKDDCGEVLFTRDAIQKATKQLGRQIAADYAHKAPLLVPILKGSFIFAADLTRALDPCPAGMSVEFVSARSYGAGFETSGTVQVSFDEAAVKGRHCVMVDDLCDSGLTLATVKERLLAAGAASVASVVLLDKKARRKVDFVPDYIGYDCPNHWVAGMGMDTNQLYRGLDEVVVLKPDAIKRALGGQ